MGDGRGAGWRPGSGLNALVEFLFPRLCLTCGAYGSSFCPACRAQILPVPPRFDLAEIEEVASVGIHQGSLRDAVIVFKYHARLSLAGPLSELMVAHLELYRTEWQFDAVVPVPLHWFRKLVRGFNQSELLALGVARAFDAPLCVRALRRRLRRPQVGLAVARREENVRGTFLPGPGFDARGLRVLLVDDVTTTGATLRECARTLREAGAAAVYAATLTRDVIPVAAAGDPGQPAPDEGSPDAARPA